MGLYIIDFRADALILKFAQSLYGSDSAIYERLDPKQRAVSMPEIGQYISHKTQGILGADFVFFIGVAPLYTFGYSEIREFAARAIEVVSKVLPDASYLALTIHGPGYGLDEIEAFESALAGVVDGLSNVSLDSNISNVTFVERNEGRARRLAAALKRLLPKSEIPTSKYGGIKTLDESTRITLRSVGYASASKPRVFVAMPFATEMDDVFHYGIQGASNAAGLLCERADLAAFTGDVIGWIKERISTAQFLIADLTNANANVYLEVGYAWGKGVPTILLCKNVDSDLKFDTRGQRCIVYTSIKHLEESLSRELNLLINYES